MQTHAEEEKSIVPSRVEADRFFSSQAGTRPTNKITSVTSTLTVPSGKCVSQTGDWSLAESVALARLDEGKLCTEGEMKPTVPSKLSTIVDDRISGNYRDRL